MRFRPRHDGYQICEARMASTFGQDHLDRVWNVVEKVGVCMMATRFKDGLRARPLEARPDRDAGLIWFVTDVRRQGRRDRRPSRGVSRLHRRETEGLSVARRPRGSA